MQTRSTATVELTTLGLGAAQFGNLNRAITDDIAQEAMEAAWDEGIRYFDTAPHYGLGLSERRLGAALRQLPRDEYVVSTKVGRLLNPTPDRAHLDDDAGFVVPASHSRRWDFSREGILRSLEASLDRLGLDRIDVLYLHDPDDHWEQASTSGIDTLIELRGQGVVSAIGVGMNQWQMPLRFLERGGIDLIMLAGRLTVLDASAVTELVPAARAAGVGIVAAGAYNSGILAAPTVPERASFDYAPASAELLERARSIATIGADFGLTLPEIAVQYCLAFDVVTSVVLGSRTAAHVRDAADRARAHAPEQLWQALAAAGLIDAPPTTTTHL